MNKKKEIPRHGNDAGNPEELGDVFVLIPDDETQTMILCPFEEGQTAIKLTKKTAEILIAMLGRQIREWL